MKRATVWLVAVVLGCSGLALASQVNGEPAPPEVPKAKQVVVRYLQLSADQVGAWDQLLANRADALEPLRLDLGQVERALQELLGGEQPDPLQVGELVLAGKSLREQMGAIHRDYVTEFEALLGAEQKQKLGALRRAEQLVPLFPPFQLFGLLPPR